MRPTLPMTRCSPRPSAAGTRSARLSAPQVGDYVVRVTTSGGSGQNRFALRADTGDAGSNANVSLSALGRGVGLQQRSRGDHGLLPRAADLRRRGTRPARRLLRPRGRSVAGPGHRAPARLRHPLRQLLHGHGAGATGHGPLAGCTVTTTTGTNGGLWQELTVPIDSTYRCSNDRDSSACWVARSAHDDRAAAGHDDLAGRARRRPGALGRVMPQLRLVSWNVRSLRDDASLVASTLRDLDPDLVCLQEVPRFLGGSRALARLASSAGLATAVRRSPARPLAVLVRPGTPGRPHGVRRAEPYATPAPPELHCR